ncbi:MAG: hypothetical protein ABL901_03125 [Hyphomicrobiaceae bacterium]
MTVRPSHIRKPYDPTPYAALQTREIAESQAPPVKAQPVAPMIAGSDGFADEAEKLEQLRAALWAAFQAGPEGGLPATLIDLTMAYTTALRLELSLLGLAKPRAGPAGTRLPPALRAKV